MGFINGLFKFAELLSGNMAKTMERDADEWAANSKSGKTADDIRRESQKIQRDVAAAQARRESKE